MVYASLLLSRIACMNTPQFVHSRVDRRLSCFQFGLMMDNVAVNVFVKGILCTYL